MEDREQRHISWHTIEYLHTEKTSDWYWIVGIISVSIALISIIVNNIIFAIFILVASFTLALFASKRPEIVEVSIEDRGVAIGNTLYLYKNLTSFWVETREAVPRVLIKSERVFMPFLVIFIDDVEHEHVREALLQHLPEEEHTEPLLEKLLIYFGF